MFSSIPIQMQISGFKKLFQIDKSFFAHSYIVSSI